MIIKVQIENEDKVYALGIDSNEFKNDQGFEHALEMLCSSLWITKRKLSAGVEITKMHTPLHSDLPLII